MKISVTTIPWPKANDTEEFVGIMRTIREIGFDGVGIEFSRLPRSLVREPKLLPGILRKAGLENGGTYSRGKASDLDWARSSQTSLFWTSIPGTDLRLAMKRLRGFAKRAKKAGKVTALHNELRSSIETEPEIRMALDEIKELSLCLDTAHAEAANVDSVKMIGDYRDRLALVHLKDLRSKLPKSAVRFRRDFVNVGKGIVDLKGVVTKLGEIGYKGHLMLEIEALAGNEPAAVVKEGFEYINSVL